MRILKTIVFAAVGAVVFGAAVFLGGFLLASVLGQDAQAALGMLVPMMLTPAAALLGAVLGARKGWRSA